MNKLLLFCAICLLSSCAVTIKQIGSVNMISSRNVESSTNYVLLRSYMGASQKELRKSKAETIQDAIEQVVKSTPGGEFLKNVKLYTTSKKYFAVEGDIWGIVTNANFRGFTTGDKVKWTKLFKDYTGTIVNLKDDKTCTIKKDSDQSITDVDYKDLTKIGSK
jgi:phage tail sheath protein FI